jgi:predicted nucleotidyltransferase
MSEFEEILKTFEEFRVKYLVIGGHAVMFYTEPRYTKDIDLFIEASQENARLVFQALAHFGAPLAGLSERDFAENGAYQMGLPPFRIDIFMSVSGVEFAAAWPRRVRTRVGGVEANIVSREDLIAMKKALGRHIDLHDVEQLEKSTEL